MCLCSILTHSTHMNPHTCTAYLAFYAYSPLLKFQIFTHTHTHTHTHTRTHTHTCVHTHTHTYTHTRMHTHSRTHTHSHTIHSGIELSDEGRYVLMTVSRGAEPRNKLYYYDLSKLDGGKIQGIPQAVLCLHQLHRLMSGVRFVLTSCIKNSLKLR